MEDKTKLAFDIFIESVIRPDEDLRNHAREAGCLDELLDIREDVLQYLYTIRRKNGSVQISPRRPG